MRLLLRHSFCNLLSRYPEHATVPLVIYEDAVGVPQQRNENLHEDFCSLYVVRRGRGTHVIDGADYGVARGDVYAMGPTMRHHFADCRDLVTDTLHFAPDIFSDEEQAALSHTAGFQALFVGSDAGAGGNGGRWLRLSPVAHGQVAEMIAELRAEWRSGTPTGALLTRALFLRLLVRLARFYVQMAVVAAPRRSGNGDESDPVVLPAAPLANGHEATVAQAVRLMEERFAEPLRIEQIAAHVCLSPDHFTTVFAQGMGRTPRDYLRFLRIERAKHLLQTSDESVTRIGQAAGFGEPAHFARAFRQATGVSPGAFRRGAGLLPTIAAPIKCSSEDAER